MTIKHFVNGLLYSQQLPCVFDKARLKVLSRQTVRRRPGHFIAT